MSKKLFTNARFFLPGGRFERCSLLVDGDTVAAVLPADEEPRPERPSSVHSSKMPGGFRADTPADTEIVDLAGRFVVPGFVDAHFHLLALALKGLRCDLSGVSSAGEVAGALAAWATHSGAGETVVGVEWDESSWSERVFPTKDMLDAAVSDRPAFARRICGHIGVVNTAFLKLLRGHDEFIDRDTGLIAEDAVFEATKLSYPPGEEIEGAMEGAIGALHRLGVTAVHDVIEERNFDAYLSGIRSSRLPLRIDALFHASPDDFDRLSDRAEDMDDKLFRPLGIKIFTDGSLGGRTAALNSPYADAHTIGDFLVEEKDLARRLARCLEKGIACAVHAVGDRALRTVLLEMLKFSPDAGVFRIEHAEVVGWDEMELLKRAPVSLFVQPNFVRNWQGPDGLYQVRLGSSRRDRCNPFGSFVANGIPFAFSSDGMPPGPLYGLKGATEHPNVSERVSTSEAIRRYTETAGTLGCRPRNAGSFERGHLADMAVLSGDPLTEDLDDIRVDRTYLGGSLVFDADAS